MFTLALGAAALLSLAIMGIGGMYIAAPRKAARGFGLPQPDPGAGTDWWLRLKGVRDIASGLAVLALMAWSGPRAVALVLLALAVIPLGDMSLVLASKGSRAAAFGMHGVTAAVMVAVAAFLLLAKA